MNEQPQDDQFQESSLDSTEYRERLMRKLNCLIAVLEVATAKVRKNIQEPAADVDRLSRIQSNLQNTLDVCLRARTALERRETLPAELPANLNQVIADSRQLKSGMHQVPMPPVRRGKAPELNPLQKAKLAGRGPIQREELAETDFDELARRLQGF